MTPVALRAKVLDLGKSRLPGLDPQICELCGEAYGHEPTSRCRKIHYAFKFAKMRARRRFLGNLFDRRMKAIPTFRDQLMPEIERYKADVIDGRVKSEVMLPRYQGDGVMWLGDYVAQRMRSDRKFETRVKRWISRSVNPIERALFDLDPYNELWRRQEEANGRQSTPEAAVDVVLTWRRNTIARLRGTFLGGTDSSK